MNLDLNQDNEFTVTITDLENTLLTTTNNTLPKKIWKDNSLPITLTSDLLVDTLERSITSNEIPNDSHSFWNKHISDKLWLPSNNNDKQTIISNSNNPAPMGSSYFSIETSESDEKLDFSLDDFEVLQPQVIEPEVLDEEEDTPLKSLKIRLFPTKEQNQELQNYFQQYTWFYNATLSIVKQHFTEAQLCRTRISTRRLRTLVESHEYREETLEDGTIVKSFVQTEGTKLQHPRWPKAHSRIRRGAINKFSYALKAAQSNLRNCNISSQTFTLKEKKDETHLVHFEDQGFPKSLLKIKSHYWFRSLDHQRAHISFKEIFDGGVKKHGCERKYDKILNRYTLFYPIEYSWFPSLDLRTESQRDKFDVKDSKRIIALDPGLRKFLVGYDP